MLRTFIDDTVKYTIKNASVVLPGCDQGFGRMLALRLDSIGFRVFAGCLQPGGEGTRKLLDTASSRLQVVPLDVTSDDSVRGALAFVESRLQGYGESQMGPLN